MTILGTVYYETYDHIHRLPGWARSERYEFCDGFYDGFAGEGKGLLHKLATSLRALF
ncbi:MAG: hypothetical protein Q4C02_04995 [Eubacteriales bacterium]|nr:hypothetical protein [Eubacteriales bacterium]